MITEEKKKLLLISILMPIRAWNRSDISQNTISKKPLTDSLPGPVCHQVIDFAYRISEKLWRLLNNKERISKAWTSTVQKGNGAVMQPGASHNPLLCRALRPLWAAVCSLQEACGPSRTRKSLRPRVRVAEANTEQQTAAVHKTCQGLLLLVAHWAEPGARPAKQQNSPGLIPTEPAQTKQKTHRSHFWEHAPRTQFPLHMGQREESANHNIGKNALSASQPWGAAAAPAAVFLNFTSLLLDGRGKGGQQVFLGVEGSDAIAGLDSAPACFGVTPCSLAELCVSVMNTVSVSVRPSPCCWLRQHSVSQLHSQPSALAGSEAWLTGDSYFRDPGARNKSIITDSVFSLNMVSSEHNSNQVCLSLSIPLS